MVKFGWEIVPGFFIGDSNRSEHWRLSSLDANSFNLRTAFFNKKRSFLALVL
jgi:hypothetical protein